MSNISFTAITDGSAIDASDVNGPLNTIYDDYNGSIDSNNLADNAVTTAKITDANVTMPKISNPYKARAYASGDQTVNDSTVTKVTLGGESFDPNNNFASSDYTVPVTGYYQVNANFYIVDTDGKIATANSYIYKNGGSIAVSILTPSTASNTMYNYSANISDVVYLSANDVINLYVNVDTTDSGTFFVKGTYTNLSIHLLSV